MENKIEINEYVRTDKGIITKAQEHFIDGLLNGKSAFGKAVKHSKDIIDLVCEGDYVNGYKVLYVCNEEPCPSGKYVDIDCNKPSEKSYFFEDEIKSIITKEQIKQIEFIIKE